MAWWVSWVACFCGSYPRGILFSRGSKRLFRGSKFFLVVEKRPLFFLSKVNFFPSNKPGYFILIDHDQIKVLEGYSLTKAWKLGVLARKKLGMLGNYAK